MNDLHVLNFQKSSKILNLIRKHLINGSKARSSWTLGNNIYINSMFHRQLSWCAIFVQP